jgi:hypothetical protein
MGNKAYILDLLIRDWVAEAYGAVETGGLIWGISDAVCMLDTAIRFRQVIRQPIWADLTLFSFFYCPLARVGLLCSDDRRFK